MKKILSLVFFAAMAIVTSSSWSQEDPAESVVQVKFKSPEHARHFMAWMSGQGEQDMGIWMEENEPELDVLPSYDFENLIIDYSRPR